MTSGMPSLLDSIFGKQSLEEISLEEIYTVLAEFPSFNAAHFLLSKKLMLENNPAYEEETMKTALYFNNPVWLQSLLEEDQPTPPPAGWQQFTEPIKEEPLFTESLNGEDNHELEVNREHYIIIQEELTTSQLPSTINEEYEEPEQEITVNEEFAEAQEFEPIVNQAFFEEPQPVITVNEEYAQEEASVLTINQEFEKEPEFVQTVNFEYTDITINPPSPDAEGQSHQPSTFNPEEEPVQAIHIHEENAKAQEFVPFENQAFYEKPQPVISGKEEYIPEEELPNIQVPINDQPSTINAEHAGSSLIFDAKKAESIVFEPYHMIDYFASQGIKLVLEDQPADSFGKQLKSFTDWLKVMKRIPPQTIAERTDERETERIRHFAANSIEERDILTETMAEVLAKQGMYENAISLYQKLSLIYPPKSAYFASRIEQLKASLS